MSQSAAGQGPDPAQVAARQAGAAQAAALLRSLGNEHRLLVLCLLQEHGEMTVGALNAWLPLSQSALSQHLARMRDEQLVCCRREGAVVYYRLGGAQVARLIATLQPLFCVSLMAAAQGTELPAASGSPLG